MEKNVLKKAKRAAQNGMCAFSGTELKEKPALFDQSRIVPKSKGGKTSSKNIRVVDPVAHMKVLGTYLDKGPEIENIRCIIDDREQVRKMAQKVSNQLLAYKRRTDRLNQSTIEWLEDQSKAFNNILKERDKLLTKTIKDFSKTNSFVRAALGVHGIGPVTISYCLAYLCLEKARHASCLWSYTGLHKASHERYEKGVTSGGNKSLRTMLFTMADSQLKTRGAYRSVYDNKKARLEVSEKMTKSYTTEGKLTDMMWKDTSAGHKHGAGLRDIMKHFLADYWMIGRRYYGLETSALYPEAILGGNHRTIQPEERGWVLDRTFQEDMLQSTLAVKEVKKEKRKYTKRGINPDLNV